SERLRVQGKPLPCSGRAGSKQALVAADLRCDPRSNYLKTGPTPRARLRSPDYRDLVIIIEAVEVHGGLPGVSGSASHLSAEGACRRLPAIMCNSTGYLKK